MYITFYIRNNAELYCGGPQETFLGKAQVVFPQVLCSDQIRNFLTSRLCVYSLKVWTNSAVSSCLVSICSCYIVSSIQIVDGYNAWSCRWCDDDVVTKTLRHVSSTGILKLSDYSMVGRMECECLLLGIGQLVMEYTFRINSRQCAGELHAFAVRLIMCSVCYRTMDG